MKFLLLLMLSGSVNALAVRVVNFDWGPECDKPRLQLYFSNRSAVTQTLTIRAKLPPAASLNLAYEPTDSALWTSCGASCYSYTKVLNANDGLRMILPITLANTPSNVTRVVQLTASVTENDGYIIGHGVAHADFPTSIVTQPSVCVSPVQINSIGLF